MAESGSNHTAEVVLNEQNFEVLVAKFIPTSQYFERSFQMLQNQMKDFKEDQKELKIDINRRFEEVHQGQKDIRADIDKRFEQVDKRVEQVDKRFEQVDKRFEQVDKRFEQVDEKITDFKKDVDKRFEQVDVKFEKVNTSINNLAIQIEKLAKSQETTIRDYIIERDRHYDAKFNNLRNYNVAIISVVAAVILKMVGIINL